MASKLIAAGAALIVAVMMLVVAAVDSAPRGAYIADPSDVEFSSNADNYMAARAFNFVFKGIPGGNHIAAVQARPHSLQAVQSLASAARLCSIGSNASHLDTIFDDQSSNCEFRRRTGSFGVGSTRSRYTILLHGGEADTRWICRPKGWTRTKVFSRKTPSAIRSRVGGYRCLQRWAV